MTTRASTLAALTLIFLVSVSAGAQQITSELRLDKREGCRKQAEAKGLGLLERIEFVRKCVE